jgi:hypothetical protein
MQAQIPEQIAYLTGALRESAQYPVPIVPQFEGLNFWYLPPDGDSPAALLAFAHQTVPGIEGGTTGEFVALSQALPIEAILERRLMPVGDEARAALGVWLELHTDSSTPMAMDATFGASDPIADQARDEVFLHHMERMEQARQLLAAVLPHVGNHAPIVLADSGATTIDAGELRLRLIADDWQVERMPEGEEMAHNRHMDRLLGAHGLLNAVLPSLGIHTTVMIEPIESTALLIGNVRATPSNQGWRVTIDEHMPEMMDLTVPEGAAFDWNDVFDAMIAARNSWRPSAYLAVINCAVAIGTQAALDFIGNYSDDTSPAHEIAAQTLARALGREDEWHTATIAGQHEPAP